MQWIDLPPVWLIAAIVVAWLQASFAPLGISFGPLWADLIGVSLIVTGAVLTAAAVFEFWRHRTTIIPHREADALITTGVFQITRNPIYLADSFFLLGAILIMDAVLSLPLVPLFLWIITIRFIQPEEERLRRKYVAQFDAYAQQAKRWL